MISRIMVAALAALALPLVAGTAQEPPTVEDVRLRFASKDSDVWRKASYAATRLLREEYGPGSAETEELIEALVDVVLATDVGVSPLNGPYWQAGAALRSAARPPVSYVDGIGYYTNEDSGKPVPEAFEALVRIYETLAARALVDGGDDPFLEAAFKDRLARTPTGSDTRYEHNHLYDALSNVFYSDLAPDGRGWAYVLVLFERSMPPCRKFEYADSGYTIDVPPVPPDCKVGPGSTWCAAGRLLHMKQMGGARPWPGPDRALWERRCGSLPGIWSTGHAPWNSDSVDWSKVRRGSG